MFYCFSWSFISSIGRPRYNDWLSFHFFYHYVLMNGLSVSRFGFSGDKGGGCSIQLCQFCSFNCFLLSILFDYKWRKLKKRNWKEMWYQERVFCWCKRLQSSYMHLLQVWLMRCPLKSQKFLDRSSLQRMVNSFLRKIRKLNLKKERCFTRNKLIMKLSIGILSRNMNKQRKIKKN